MLDSLAAAGAGAPPPSMMSSNRALRSARDAVDSHHVWELDPDSIRDLRIQDRLEIGDVSDLRQSIEQNGQAVPILVRRDPKNSDKYILVYGLRRLTAVRESETVTKVRALVATMSEMDGLRMQAAENSERRDLSYLEKALFAQGLMDGGYGNQDKVAETLNVTKSWMSMAKGILFILGRELPGLIGPAPGIGRPRWEALTKGMNEHYRSRDPLIELVEETRAKLEAEIAAGNAPEKDPSILIFEALEKAVEKKGKRRPRKPVTVDLTLEGKPAGKARRTPKGLALDLNDRRFAHWIERQSQDIITELYARYQARDNEDEQ